MVENERVQKDQLTDSYFIVNEELCFVLLRNEYFVAIHNGWYFNTAR